MYNYLWIQSTLASFEWFTIWIFLKLHFEPIFLFGYVVPTPIIPSKHEWFVFFFSFQISVYLFIIFFEVLEKSFSTVLEKCEKKEEALTNDREYFQGYHIQIWADEVQIRISLSRFSI